MSRAPAAGLLDQVGRHRDPVLASPTRYVEIEPPSDDRARALGLSYLDS